MKPNYTLLLLPTSLLTLLLELVGTQILMFHDYIPVIYTKVTAVAAAAQQVTNTFSNQQHFIKTRQDATEPNFLL
jgi:hypothetical protein